MSFKHKSTEGYIPFSLIEPRLVREHKHVAREMKALKITLPQEEFLLKCLLSLEWNRCLIISYIEKFKREGSLGMTRYKFTLTAPSRSLSYCDSNPYEEDGWSESIKTFEDRAHSVYNTFRARLH